MESIDFCVTRFPLDLVLENVFNEHLWPPAGSKCSPQGRFRRQTEVFARTQLSPRLLHELPLQILLFPSHCSPQASTSRSLHAHLQKTHSVVAHSATEPRPLPLTFLCAEQELAHDSYSASYMWSLLHVLLFVPVTIAMNVSESFFFLSFK